MKELIKDNEYLLSNPSYTIIHYHPNVKVHLLMIPLVSLLCSDIALGNYFTLALISLNYGAKKNRLYSVTEVFEINSGIF